MGHCATPVIEPEEPFWDRVETDSASLYCPWRPPHEGVSFLSSGRQQRRIPTHLYAFASPLPIPAP